MGTEREILMVWILMLLPIAKCTDINIQDENEMKIQIYSNHVHLLIIYIVWLAQETI